MDNHKRLDLTAFKEEVLRGNLCPVAIFAADKPNDFILLDVTADTLAETIRQQPHPFVGVMSFNATGVHKAAAVCPAE